MEETQELKGGTQSHHDVHLIFVNERIIMRCRKGEGRTLCCV